MSKSTAVATRKSTAVADWKAEAAAIAAETEAVAAQTVGNWMSVRGGTLTFKGQEIETPMPALILRSMLENAYYEGPYDPDNPQPPTCFALGFKDEDMVPHDNSQAKQAERCGLCEWNKFGTATGGSGKGKACKNQVRIALLSANDITQDGINEASIGLLRVPVTSSPGLKTHLQAIPARAGKGTPSARVVSQMIVTPDAKTQVHVEFGFPNPKNIVLLPEKVMPAVMARAREATEQLTQPYAPVNSDETQAAPPRKNRAVKRAPVRRAPAPAAKPAPKAAPKAARKPKEQAQLPLDEPQHQRRSKF